jgi:hypothetical protein
LRGRCHNYAKEWGSSSCSIKRTSISMRRITSLNVFVTDVFAIWSDAQKYPWLDTPWSVKIVPSVSWFVGNYLSISLSGYTSGKFSCI